MKKTTLIGLVGVLGCMYSAWGLGITIGSIPHEYTSYGTPDNRDSVSIGIQWWNSAWTGVEASFHSGEALDKDAKGDGSGNFYFTSGSVNAQGNIKCTLNAENAMLNFSKDLKVSGNLNATNTNITATYLAVTGDFNMNGGKLALTGDRSDLPALGLDATYQIIGNMNLKDVEFSAAGRITASTATNASTGEPMNGNLILSGNTSFKGTELHIKDGTTFSMLDNSSIDVDGLLASNMTISKDSKIIVDSYDKLGIVNLNIVLDSLESINFSDIFISETEGETVVFSANKPNISVVDSLGNTYEDVNFAYDESGNITGISVPEPSTYAAILGAVALAFAAYRRRK